MDPNAAEALVGTLIAERYKVLCLLGQGGMGSVFEVEHVLIGRHFALKTLHPEFARNAEAVARFHREARAAAAIGDEHITDVSDMGKLNDGSPFIVLELLDGKDLGKLLNQTGPMTLQRAIRIVRQACGALARAHEKGIVHRDIKPDNIFILQRRGADFVKLVDFGISKMHESVLGLGSPSLTQTGAALGTPYYMAPEQMRGDRQVDARVDVYAMGVVVFELLMGRVPFEAPTFPGLIIKVMQDEPPPMRAFRPDVPAALEAVVFRALAKDPAQRFARIDALGDALAEFESLPSDPPKASRREPLVMTATPKTWEVEPESTALPRNDTPKYVFAAIAAACAVLALLSLVTNRGGSDAQGAAKNVLRPPPVSSAPHLGEDAVSAARPKSGETQRTNNSQPLAAPTVEPAPKPVAALPIKPQRTAATAALFEREAHAPHRSHRSARSEPAVETPRPAPIAAPVVAPPPAPVPAPIALRSVAIDNQRRASTSVSLLCAGKSYEGNVGAMTRAVLSVPAASCAVACRGVGNPRCPQTLSADARAIEVK